MAVLQAMLVRLGCPNLGQVRALPRGGISRRIDAGLLAALDPAYDLRADRGADLDRSARHAQRQAALDGARRARACAAVRRTSPEVKSLVAGRLEFLTPLFERLATASRYFDQCRSP